MKKNKTIVLLPCECDGKFKKLGTGGGGEETRSETEKRCSHNLQSGAKPILASGLFKLASRVSFPREKRTTTTTTTTTKQEESFALVSAIKYSMIF